jgi:hypothetical protein
MPSPSEPVEPIEPVEPVEPIEPVEPVEPEPPDDHPDWVLAKQLARRDGVGGAVDKHAQRHELAVSSQHPQAFGAD